METSKKSVCSSACYRRYSQKFSSPQVSLIPLLSLCKFIYLFVCLFIYFWLHWVFIAARGLSRVAASTGYSLLWCAGLLIVVASLVVEHGL